VVTAVQLFARGAHDAEEENSYVCRTLLDGRELVTVESRLEAVLDAPASAASRLAAAQTSLGDAHESVLAAREAARVARARAREAQEAQDAALAARLQQEEDAAAVAAGAAAAVRGLAAAAQAPGDLGAALAALLRQLDGAPGVHVAYTVHGGAPAPAMQGQPPHLGSLFSLFGLGPTASSYEELLALAERMGGAVPRGATPAQVAALPTRMWAPGDADATCSVCLCDYAEGETLRALPCHHSFHAACVDQWLKTSRACPCCRADMVA